MDVLELLPAMTRAVDVESRTSGSFWISKRDASADLPVVSTTRGTERVKLEVCFLPKG